MKKLFLSLGLAFSILLLSNSAQAGLIGDSILIEHLFPTTSNIHNSATTVVQAGPADTITSFTQYDTNVEDTSILVDYKLSSTWATSPFNGLRVSNIDDLIASVSTNTNLAGWDNSRLSYTDHSVSFNWSGLQFTSNSYFYADLEFRGQGGGGSSNAVPEPATMILVSLGLMGSGLSRIKNSKS